MSMQAVLDRFIKLRPVAVMARAINQIIVGEDLDIVFEENRDRQYQRNPLFSHLNIAMADVVLGIEKSPNQAYKTHKEELRVSAAASYDKLNNVETSISEGMVRYAFEKSRDLQDQLGFAPVNRFVVIMPE